MKRHDIYMITDEVYEKIIYEGEHFSPGSLDPDGRVITILATSKTYAMTGWRIGYFAAPTPVAKAMEELWKPTCPVPPRSRK